MNKAYERINWENYPSEETALNESNLNRMDAALNEVDNRVVAHETTKLDKATANSMVRNISFNERTGIFTITYLNGSTKELDTKLEKIATNFRYDYATQKLILTLVDGTTQEIDMSTLITQYEFADSSYIKWTIMSDGKIKAEIINGSITADKLQPNFLADVTLQANSAKTSEQNAKVSEENAKQSEINAKNYADSAEPVASTANRLNPTLDNSTSAPIISFNGDGATIQDGEPIPDNKVPIFGVGDKGFFDGDLENGDYLSADGSFVSATFKVRTVNKIPIKKGDIVVPTADKVKVFYAQAWNTSGGYIGNITSGWTEIGTPITIQNDGFVTFTFKVADDVNITPQTAGHICVTINGKYCLPVKTTGANIFGGLPFAQAIVDSGSTNVVLNTDAKTVTFAHNTNYQSRDSLFENFKENTQYTFILNGKSPENTSNTQFVVSYTDGTSTVISWDGANKEQTIAFITDSNKNVSNIAYRWINANATNILNYEQCGIFEGVITADDFEPYTETKANIPLSSPLHEGDYIRYNMDGSGEESHKMMGVVLDGSDDEGWKKSGNFTTFYCQLIGAKQAKDDDNSGKVQGICSHFTMSESYRAMQSIDGYGHCGFGIYTDNTTTCFGVYTNHETLDDFKTWLAENPITVVYELAKPTVTPLTAEQIEEFEKLRTFDGVTNVTCDGETEISYFRNNGNGKAVALLDKRVTSLGSRGFSLVTQFLLTYNNPLENIDAYNPEHEEYLLSVAVDGEVVNTITVLAVHMLMSGTKVYFHAEDSGEIGLYYVLMSKADEETGMTSFSTNYEGYVNVALFSR